jgi:hypothetical protein
MEFEARDSMRGAGEEASPESPEAWRGHIEDDFWDADEVGVDAADSSTERN